MVLSFAEVSGTGWMTSQCSLVEHEPNAADQEGVEYQHENMSNF